MIDRYSLPEMSGIWTEENRFQKMLDVEIAVVLAMAEAGLVPKKAAQNIKRKASFKISQVNDFERVTKHDVTAFLKSVGKSVGKDARFVHLGLTSSDVLDTALPLQILPAVDVILKKAQQLRASVKKQSLKYKHTPAMGRTHGIHAEPTTFGLKLLLYYEEFGRDIERVKRAKENIAYGKLSGAVGTHASISPALEKRVMKKLGLTPAPVSTQVLQRDRHAEVMASLAILAASLEKLATEIRHLQRTEVREVEESFSKGQTGSSAMPHKKNPVNCERITGLSRVVRANLIAALENIALWHERDISHSSVERVIFPDSFLLVDFMLDEMTKIIRNMRVYPKQMMANIQKTRGLIFSQRLLTACIKKGMSRFDAYALVQKLAMKVWDDEKHCLPALATQDPRIMKLFTARELDKVFDLQSYLKYVNAIYKKAL